MTKFTHEQQAAIAFSAESQDSGFLDSVAGSGKTTTGVAMAEHAPPGTKAIAFGKRNADDFKERMPLHVDSTTFNSFGHRTFGASVRGRITLNNWKLADLVKAKLKESINPEEDGYWDFYNGTMRVLGLAKTVGYCPPGVQGLISLYSSREDFFLRAEEESDDPFLSPREIDDLLRQSIHMAISNRVIDFADQICLPLMMRLRIEKQHTIIVDEAQDLNHLQHLWLQSLVGERLIAMGDPFQAIYGWRGADTHSCETLIKLFSMKVLNLSYCFRCPTSVIKEAQQWVPNIRAPEDTREGLVEKLESFEFGKLQDGDTIICRNNAPLFAAAIKLLLRGVRPNVLGSGDLARGLANFPFNKLKCSDQDTISTMLSRLDLWELSELARTKDGAKKDRISDRVACIRLFTAGQKTVYEYKMSVESVLKEGLGTVTLSTVHKFKGMEASRVFILQPELLNPFNQRSELKGDELQQVKNLFYVAQTRASDELRYVDAFDDGE